MSNGTNQGYNTIDTTSTDKNKANERRFRSIQGT